MKKTLLFYDLETSGLSPLDQVLEYAAIRYSLDDFQEIDRQHIQINWRRDMIPSTQAFLVHQIPILGRANAVSEWEGIQKIHQSLNAPGTLSGGYNTLGFDDEMLRFSFYRNLLTPYTHQYASGCGRFDILPLVVFYYLYAEDAMIWPRRPDGTVSFKLEDLNKANNWVEGRAHEAMIDVEVTVVLAKLMRLNRPMWDYLMGYYDKQIDQDRIQKLMQQPNPFQGVGLMTGLRFGSRLGYQCPVLHIGGHHLFKNQRVFLRLDQPIESLDETVLSKLVVKKKLGEPCFVLPYSSKYTDRLSEALQDQVKQNLLFLSHHEHQQQLQQCRHQSASFTEHVDLDASLYHAGFLSKEEQSWCEQFHLAQGNGRSLLLSRVDNPLLKEQALRYLWRYMPEQLSKEDQLTALDSIKRFMSRSQDYKGKPFLRIDEALSDAKQAMRDVTDPKIKEGIIQIIAHIQSLQDILSSQCSQLR